MNIFITRDKVPLCLPFDLPPASFFLCFPACYVE
uniref:Uncharacterized protein n=1 Tax=Rhizophora mucronata TaxID=61149 RepID=A0A2P2QJR8_RHIMU